MEFGNGYYGPMDRGYYARPGEALEYSRPPPPQPQIMNVDDIGQSVTEGSRFGSFVTTMQNAIRTGVAKIELASGMGGGQEPVGVEGYGKDAREALRELSKANKVDIVSIHAPTNIGNLSGYNPQQHGFDDEYRKAGLEEVKKAIEFAADTGGGAVVVHTGEYPRIMSDQPWAKDSEGKYRFLLYEEEPGKAVASMVDDRTGRVITEVRKNMVFHEPIFKRDQRTGKYIDRFGKILDENNPDDLINRVPEWDSVTDKFNTQIVSWDDFAGRAKKWNQDHPDDPKTPEEMFYRSQIEIRIAQSRGSSMYYSQGYEDSQQRVKALDKAVKFYEDLEKRYPKDEVWKIMEEDPQRLVPPAARITAPERKLPSQIITEQLRDEERRLKHIHEASSSADAQAMEMVESLKHVMPVEKYAKTRTAISCAEAGITAMEQSQNNPNIKRDVYVAPENIYPDMGYGSHPEELIEMVKTARKKMVELLTEPYIDDPHRRLEPKDPTRIQRVSNPYYQKISKSQAEHEAKQHIKATLDTQHLGMWWKHFQAKPEETKDERKERFNKWYMEQIEKLEKEDVIGHIHLVDALGGGHHHLPAGQGDLPLKDAIEYLKKKGYKGTIISEGHGEDSLFGAGRIMTETWKYFGSPISSVPFPTRGATWPDMHNTYFRQMQSPYFIFGAYAPSNDWQMWSQVPIE